MTNHCGTLLLSASDDSPLIAALHALLNPSKVDEHLVCAVADATNAPGEGPRTFLLHGRFNEDLAMVDVRDLGLSPAIVEELKKLNLVQLAA